MWRPGFVLWGWDFSKTYFPSERLAPSLAILCHHHTIQILSEFRQNQIEPNERSLGRSGCKQPTIYDFKVVIWTFLDFKIFQNPNFWPLRFWAESKSKSGTFTILKLKMVGCLSKISPMSVHWAIVISDEIFGDLNCMMVAQNCERGSQYLRQEVRNRIKNKPWPPQFWISSTCVTR